MRLDQRLWLAVRCWREKVPFIYDTATGFGYAVEGYNPFKDMFRVRLSQFGYVEEHQEIARDHFVAFASPLNVEFDAWMRLSTGRPPDRSGVGKSEGLR